MRAGREGAELHGQWMNQSDSLCLSDLYVWSGLMYLGLWLKAWQQAVHPEGLSSSTSWLGLLPVTVTICLHCLLHLKAELTKHLFLLRPDWCQSLARRGFFCISGQAFEIFVSHVWRFCCQPKDKTADCNFIRGSLPELLYLFFPISFLFCFFPKCKF